MSNNDKNIVITPNRGQVAQPKIVFTGQENTPITLSVLDNNTISFDGYQGQLFSVSHNLASGTIFSVNDISGIPSIRVNADGTVGLAEFSGNVGIGTTAPGSLLHVFKSQNADTIISITNGTNGTAASTQVAFSTASGAASFGAFPSSYTAGGAFLANKSGWYNQTLTGGMFFGDAPVGGGGIYFTTNGTPSASLERLHIKSTGETVFNEPGNDYDFRIEGDTDINLLFIDASTDFVGIGTNTPNSKLQVAGSLSLPITTKTANYTATSADHTILCDANSGAITITLPTAVGIAGRIYVVKKTDSSVNNVVIDGNGSEIIDGSLTQTLTGIYESITIQSNGSDWFVL